MVAIASHASPGSGVTTVAIATTGAVDAAGRVLRAGTIAGYEDIDWAEIITRQHPHLHVTVVNDGAAACWAEHTRRGGYGTHAHVVVGTGIGGGLVVDGRLLTGAHGAAGRLGHITVAPEGDTECSCGQVGCVETVAASDAIVARYRQLARPDAHRRASLRRDGSPQSHPPIRHLTVRRVAEAGHRGDLAARQAFRDAGHWLGIALATVINTVDPAAITVGGGLLAAASLATGNDPDDYLAAAERAARAHTAPRLGGDVSLDPAAYGNNGGLLGAAQLALASTTTRPST